MGGLGRGDLFSGISFVLKSFLSRSERNGLRLGEVACLVSQTSFFFVWGLTKMCF